MKIRKLIDNTDNSSVWKKAWKRKHARCAHCPWHRVENAVKVTRNWKRFRKKRFKKA